MERGFLQFSLDKTLQFLACSRQQAKANRPVQAGFFDSSIKFCIIHTEEKLKKKTVLSNATKSNILRY